MIQRSENTALNYTPDEEKMTNESRGTQLTSNNSRYAYAEILLYVTDTELLLQVFHTRTILVLLTCHTTAHNPHDH